MRAMATQLTVVAAVTEKGIVRAISHMGASVQDSVNEIVKAVGLFNMDGVEWSGYTYHLPYYVSQWASCWDVPGGIYLFPWIEQTPFRGEPSTFWQDPNRRISQREGELLWRPQGWAGDKAERTQRVRQS